MLDASHPITQPRRHNPRLLIYRGGNQQLLENDRDPNKANLKKQAPNRIQWH